MVLRQVVSDVRVFIERYAYVCDLVSDDDDKRVC